LVLIRSSFVSIKDELYFFLSSRELPWFNFGFIIFGFIIFEVSSSLRFRNSVVILKRDV